MLITFEGGEGVGKSTLIASLADVLRKRGLEVVVTREPGSTPLGEALRGQLLEVRQEIAPLSELFLFLAARIEHVERVIKPALKRGASVLCDRFNDSTIAYQGAGRGVGVERARFFCEEATKGTTPHLTFLLDMPPKEAMARLKRGKDRIEAESLDFHERVREAYLQVAKHDPKRVIVIDASKSPGEVLTTALSYVDRK